MGAPRLVRIDAAGVFDAAGTSHTPGSILIERTHSGLSVLAVGTPRDVDGHLASARARRLDRTGSVLLPGLVNAHAHLDLTHIGPVPFDPIGGFGAFVDRIRAERHVEAEGIAASVQRGIDLSLSGGVVAVGDIAGAPMGRPTLVPYETLKGSPLAGVSFVEFFAIGTIEHLARERVRSLINQWRSAGNSNTTASVRLGLQPHAPYSVLPDSYRFANDLAATDLPLSTHLAETMDEREFLAHANGRQRDFLERIGIWDDSILNQVGLRRRPIDHLLPVLAERPYLCAHVHDVTDEEITALARAHACVAYCPRAAAYFRAPDAFGPHRYRDMISAGITVALGTDSILNLPSESSRISTLDEIRFLHQRDRTDPTQLLAMATIHGADALGMDRSGFLLRTGSRPLGVLAVPLPAGALAPSIASALSTEAPPEVLLLARNHSCETGEMSGQ